MESRHAIGRREYERMTTRELRDAFVIENVFHAGELRLVYWENDRTVVGGAVPTGAPLKLRAGKELAAEYFLERRELGIINLGGSGIVTTDGASHVLARLECLYVGRGTREVSFANTDNVHPAKFFLMSYPAHTSYP